MERSGSRAAVDERYAQWKSLIPVLYDWFASHNLVWPSLSRRRGPQFEKATYKNWQRLYVSEQVLIWDVETQPNGHAVLGATESRPDLILTGHKEYEKFALAMCPAEPYVLSGGKGEGSSTRAAGTSDPTSTSDPFKNREQLKSLSRAIAIIGGMGRVFLCCQCCFGFLPLNCPNCPSSRLNCPNCPSSRLPLSFGLWGKWPLTRNHLFQVKNFSTNFNGPNKAGL